MNAEMEFEAGYSDLTNVQSFFYGQPVFLTGVTGLVGKVVLEKLLRSCPGIGMIYVLMRQKRGLTSEQRLEKIFQLELFKIVKEVFPLFRKRVQIVEGDISKDKLGLSFDDYETLRQNVSIVIHSAASVHFNDPLKVATLYNLKATENVLKMVQDFPNIKSFVHISTSYVKRESDGSILEEIPYNDKIQPEQLMDAMEWMDDKTQESATEFLAEGALTTYLITKALAEVHISNHRGDLPVAIVRPAYIGPSYREPFPGWIDTIQGVSGLFLAGSKGVLRTLMSVEGFRPNIIPVDLVSNMIVTSAWHAGITRPPSLFILNASFEYYSLPLADVILPSVLSKREQYPLVKMFRYPDFTVYHSPFAYYVHALIDQWIPAVIIDMFLFIFTGRTILVKVYKKIDYLYGIFFKLGKVPWLCRVDNVRQLRASLSERDAEVFDINIENFDWMEYIDVCLIGGRKFLAKEDPSNVPYAKKKAYIWWLVTTTLKWILILYFIYYLFNSSLIYPIYESIEEKFFSL